MTRPQRIAILGSTGSVGTSTLDVVARHPDRFEVFGLSGNRRLDELVAQALQFRPRVVAVPGVESAELRYAITSTAFRKVSWFQSPNKAGPWHTPLQSGCASPKASPMQSV